MSYEAGYEDGFRDGQKDAPKVAQDAHLVDAPWRDAADLADMFKRDYGDEGPPMYGDEPDYAQILEDYDVVIAPGHREETPEDEAAFDRGMELAAGDIDQAISMLGSRRGGVTTEPVTLSGQQVLDQIDQGVEFWQWDLNEANSLFSSVAQTWPDCEVAGQSDGQVVSVKSVWVPATMEEIGRAWDNGEPAGELVESGAFFIDREGDGTRWSFD